MITYVPLDFETSSIEPWGDVMDKPLAAPIQLGIYLPASNLRLSYMIGGWDWNEYEWNETSESIHGFTREEVDAAEPAWKVDIRIAANLLDLTGGRMFTVPLGWNVAGFDRQFITRHFPNLNRLLSYRSIDLNAVIFSQVNSEKEYNELKQSTKEYAAKRMKAYASERLEAYVEKWHNAVYDAEASWYAYEFLRENRE